MPVTRRSAFNVTYAEGWLRTRNKFDKVKQGYMTLHSWRGKLRTAQGTKHWALFVPMGWANVEIRALTHHKICEAGIYER